MSLPVATIGLIGGSTNAWKVSFNKDKGQVTIGYGTMFYNGKYFTTNDIDGGSITSGIGVDQVIALSNALNNYIYINILNPVSLPKETSDSLKIKIRIIASQTAPDSSTPINTKAPLIEYIPLAFLDDKGKVSDLRPSFWVNNFSVLA